VSENPLGQQVDYTNIYTPSLLHPMKRSESRALLGFDVNRPLPFEGVDIWNCHEVSWLNRRGRPEVGVLELMIPCHSACMMESKSVKMYLNSFSGTRFNTRAEVLKTVSTDLSVAAQCPVDVKFLTELEPMNPQKSHAFLLDNLEVDIKTYEPDSSLLVPGSGGRAAELLYTQIFKTNCPVTGQPDWASVFITYRGQSIDHAGLLKYLVSYREYEGFHESSVEKIYMDILEKLEPDQLTVYARYTRRGGIDINPYRSNFDFNPINRRAFRQ